MENFDINDNGDDGDTDEEWLSEILTSFLFDTLWYILSDIFYLAPCDLSQLLQWVIWRLPEVRKCMSWAWYVLQTHDLLDLYTWMDWALTDSFGENWVMTMSLNPCGILRKLDMIENNLKSGKNKLFSSLLQKSKMVGVEKPHISMIKSTDCNELFVITAINGNVVLVYFEIVPALFLLISFAESMRWWASSVLNATENN